MVIWNGIRSTELTSVKGNALNSWMPLNHPCLSILNGFFHFPPTGTPNMVSPHSISRCPVQAATVFQGCMPRERRRRSRQRGACHWGNLLVDVFFFDKRGHGGSPSHIGFNTKSLKSLKSCSNDWDDLGVPLSLSKPPYSVQTEFCTNPARVSI